MLLITEMQPQCFPDVCFIPTMTSIHVPTVFDAVRTQSPGGSLSGLAFNALFFYKTYLFLDALGLRCCVQASLHLQQMVASLQWRCALLPEMASLVAEHRLWDMQASTVVVLSCSTTRGIFPGQGWRRAWLHRLKVSLLEVNPGWNIHQLCDLETQSPHLHRHILFYYTSQLLHFFFFFTTEGLRQLYLNPVCQHCFSYIICSLHVSGSHFGNSCNISNFVIIVMFVMVIFN